MENLAISSSAVLYISGHLGEGGGHLGGGGGDVCGCGGDDSGGGGDDSGGGGEDDDREYEIYKPTYKTIVLTNLCSFKAFKKDVEFFWKMNSKLINSKQRS